MHPELLVLGPSTALWSSRTLLAIHGKGNNAREFAHAWRPLLDDGWTLLVPQSSQAYKDGGFCWDDAEQARSELRAHVERAARQGVDMEELVIAGVSQGAPLALELAREMSRPWLCVVPSFSTDFDLSPWGAGTPVPPGAFLLGELDPARAGAMPVIQALESSGVKVLTRIMKNIAHALPQDFAVHASQCLEEIRRGNASFFERTDTYN